mgnify:FL=1|tara:strand:+ start:77 stop:526 length:450 start_codon:yes stop_codon:yes gene_type:complete
MAISAHPLERVGSTPILKLLFDDLGLNRTNPIQFDTGRFFASNENGAGADENEVFAYEPGQTDPRQRVINLIERNRPGAALDLIQILMSESPELVEDIAADVYDALLDAGFEKDALELQTMLEIQDPYREPEKPEATAKLAAPQPIFFG